MAINIIVTGSDLEAAYERFCEMFEKGKKAVAQLVVPDDENPLFYAKSRVPTARKVFAVEICGVYLSAFKRVHGNIGNRRAFILIT